MKNYQKKAIFIDINGTLVTDSDIITERTKKAIERVKDLGHEVILCTGSDPVLAKLFSKRVGCNTYIIHSNGGCVYDSVSDQNLFTVSIDRKVLREFYESLRNENLIYIISSADKKYVTHLTEFDIITSEEVIIKDFSELIGKTEILQIVVCSNSHETMKRIEGKIKAIPQLKIANMSKELLLEQTEDKLGLYFDIVPLITNKGTAAKWIAEKLGIPFEYCIGIGDSINDISTFEVCGIKVAMGNAVPCLKEIANIITNTNNDDGVAKFLESLS